VKQAKVTEREGGKAIATSISFFQKGCVRHATRSGAAGQLGGATQTFHERGSNKCALENTRFVLGIYDIRQPAELR
jgi:hypothetical protein